MTIIELWRQSRENVWFEKRRQGGAPKECIDEVLSISGLNRSDIDVVVFSRAEFTRSLFKTGFFRKLRDDLKNKSATSRDLTTVMIKAGTSTPSDVIDIQALLRFYDLPQTANTNSQKESLVCPVAQSD